MKPLTGIEFKQENNMAGRILTCVYCGHQYPQDTPAHGDKVLTDHITVCEKHPMRSVIEERDKLRAALVDIIGSSTEKDLNALELGVRITPGSEQDKAMSLNAINALQISATPSG